MKLTDEEIKNEVRSIVMAGLNNPASQKTLTGLAKWARDKACEWVPVSRELPELKILQKHRTGTDYVSDKVIMVIGGQSFLGYYRFDQAAGYEKYYFEDQYGEEFEVSKVEHWQYAPETPKSK